MDENGHYQNILTINFPLIGTVYEHKHARLIREIMPP
jgi:hypothetical protein